MIGGIWSLLSDIALWGASLLVLPQRLTPWWLGAGFCLGGGTFERQRLINAEGKLLQLQQNHIFNMMRMRKHIYCSGAF